ncbi:MAG: hypothetical protein IT566_04150, partial [Rhodospirillaceae bacterium]|nr:hypothetical protein [Rhodospirillaceae bacterium]
MKQRDYLVRRGDSYSVRVMIPKDVRSFYGSQKEIMKALGTTDPKEAEVRKHAALNEIFAEFQAHRSRRTPTAEDVAGAADLAYRIALDDDLRKRDTALNESAYETERHRLYREMPDGPAREEALSDLKALRYDPERAAWWRNGWEVALRQHI